jgi:NAD(P)-dependent dehydrogenase (short-subunit alcohol dehydrogenase family)
MSPIKQMGAPDPNRGTEPVSISPDRYAGKVVVVTGAGSGIGRATARRIAAEGGSVACLDIAVDHLETVVAEIDAARPAAVGGTPGRAAPFRCDVTDEGSVAEAFEALRSKLGAPSVVCNVAGVGRFAHTTELTLAEWNAVLAVNLTGTFLVARAALPDLLVHGGAIVNTSSTAGVMGQPYSAAYCASKGGVSMLTKALAVEFMDRGVRVNAVAPGGVDTPLVWEFGFPEGANPKSIDRLMSPMGFCTPAEVASAFAYLGSDEAGYVSGEILSIDGALAC